MSTNRKDIGISLSRSLRKIIDLTRIITGVSTLPSPAGSIAPVFVFIPARRGTLHNRLFDLFGVHVLNRFFIDWNFPCAHVDNAIQKAPFVAEPSKQQQLGDTAKFKSILPRCCCKTPKQARFPYRSVEDTFCVHLQSRSFNHIMKRSTFWTFWFLLNTLNCS